MTAEEYQRICGRIARKATAYAEQMASDDGSSHVTSEREHWIDVYLDEHLPDINADAVLEVTPRADAYAKSAGHSAPSRAIAAVHALQADVWAAINAQEAL